MTRRTGDQSKTERRTPIDPPPWVVDRPALLARLDALAPGHSAVLSAPAGYGKTTLVAQWVEQQPEPVSWVSLEACSTEREVRDELSRDAVSATLEGEGPRLLVVDGLRLRTPVKAVADLVAAVAGAKQHGARAVVTTRSRPPAPVARHVVEGRAVVLTDQDLALAQSEALQVVEGTSGGLVPGPLLEGVATATGGWPAAVAAVAQAWRGARSDAPSAAAAGMEVVHAYVMEEVLDGEVPEVVDLLSDIAALDVVNGALCDAVTARIDSGRLLARAREGGALLSPVEPMAAGSPEASAWFRLHPALRSTLAIHVPESAPGRRAEVVDAAIPWLRERGEPLVAARLLADVGRWDEVEDVLQANVGELLAAGRGAEMARILSSAPGEVMARQGYWIVALATLELISGNALRCLELIAVGERWMRPATRMVADVLRADTGVYLGELQAARSYGEAALVACDELGEDYQFKDLFNRSRTEHYRVIARGHLVLAGALASEWTKVEHHGADPGPDVLAEMASSAVVQVVGQHGLHAALAGETDRAERLAASAAAAGVDGDALVARGAAAGLLAAGEAARCAARPRDAVAPLRAARVQTRHDGRVVLDALAVGALALALLDDGELEEAAAVLDDQPHDVPVRARTVAGMLTTAKARLSAARGDLAGAAATLEGGIVTSQSALTAVDVAIRAHRPGLLRRVLERWPSEVTVANRVRRGLASATEHLLAGRRSQASAAVEPALVLAARHGLIQPVVELSEHLAPLLRAGARGRGEAAALCETVLGAVPESRLSVRQEAVLSLLSSGHTLQSAAGELHISVNTVKKHVRAIYRELGVHDRGAALEAWEARHRRAGSAG